jgi:hypothetical protein
MRNILLLFATLFFASLGSWGQNGYSTTWQFGVIDGASYCTNTTNCWHAMGSAFSPVSGAIGFDGYMLWLKSDHSAYSFDSSTQAWSTVNLGDLYTQQLAIFSQSTMYRLKSSDVYCGSGPTFRTQTWNGTAFVNLTSYNDCKYALAIGYDGTLMSLDWGNAAGGPVYVFRNGSWVRYGTQNLLTIGVSSQSLMCGITRQNGPTQLYTITKAGNDFSLFSPQPSGTLQGCAFADDPNGGNPVMMVWNSQGAVYNFDPVNNVWDIVVTPAVGGAVVSDVIAVGSAQTFMTMTGTGGGTVYHYNRYPGYVAGTISGAFQTCPGLQQCPGNAVHTVKLQVQFPHGVNGLLASQSGSPQTQLSATGYDFSFDCDPFTNPGDPECTPTSPVDGGFCSIVGALGGGSPLPPNTRFSEDIESYSGTNRTLAITGGGNDWIATISCDATDNRCGGGTQAVCGPPTITPAPIKVLGICLGGNCTSADAVGEARLDCANHAYLNHGAWGEFYVYIPGLAKQTCQRVTFYRVTPYATPCF